MRPWSKILIVDDHPANVFVLEEILGTTYQVATAASGEEALARAPHFLPDLILLDVMMPGIDGYETCRCLRALPSLRYTKIIMVSAKAMVAERLQGYEAGADDYVTKPFEEAELLAKVRVYMRLKSIEEVDQLKTDVLSLLSHETLTPLNTIVAPLQMLRYEEDINLKERTMFLDMALQSAQRLRKLFNQVLTLGTMKSGAWDFELVRMDVNDLVQDAVRTVSPQALERQIRIEQELTDEATALVDLEQILGVLTTLLENAIRVSPPEGRVVMRVMTGDDGFRIVVRDQGEGIAPDRLSHVFDGLHQTDISHHTEGAGLSLAIAQQVVQAHAGTIEVKSVPGAGATFTVRLPLPMPTDGPPESVGAETGSKP